MNKSEKKVAAILALLIAFCFVGVTAVSFLYESEDESHKNKTFVSATLSNEKSSEAAPATDEADIADAVRAETASDNKTTTGAAMTAEDNNFAITLDEAKAIALKDSNKDESSVTFIKQKLGRDDGIYEYEIEFHDGVTEWEYDINAQTGEIISRSSEPYDYD